MADLSFVERAYNVAILGSLGLSKAVALGVKAVDLIFRALSDPGNANNPFGASLAATGLPQGVGSGRNRLTAAVARGGWFLLPTHRWPL